MDKNVFKLVCFNVISAMDLQVITALFQIQNKFKQPKLPDGFAKGLVPIMAAYSLAYHTLSSSPGAMSCKQNKKQSDMTNIHDIV